MFISSYPYNLTVYFNEIKEFEVYNAKLKLRFFGRNISEHVFLSKDYESFKTGDIRTYTVSSLYPVQKIDGLTLRWTAKPTLSLSRLIWHNRLFINDVVLVPRYTTRYSKRFLKKRFCSFNRTCTMRPREEYIFPIRCN